MKQKYFACYNCRDEVDIGVGTQYGPPLVLKKQDCDVSPSGSVHCPQCGEEMVETQPPMSYFAKLK